jgi:putative DNA primase/helicase
MLALLPSEAGISVSHEIFDTNPWILNVDNGLVNLRTGQLQDHRPEDYCTKLSPTTFDPKALSPRWERFILEIMLANGEMAAFLRRLTGYALTGDTSEQIWVYLWGKGSNGKSTFLAVLRRILGQYAVNTPAETFLHTSGDRIRNDLARLKGARLVTASEPSGERFDVGTLKAFTGGDTISARFMRREYFDYRPTGKLFFSANKRLEVRDQTLGFWRRVIIIPFRAEFPKNNRLEEELMAEAPAILAWAIRGCLEWQATGLQIPESVRLAVEDYRSATDFLDDFLKEHCASGEGMSVTVKRLYEEYSGYCEERKIRKPLSAQKFNEDLLSRPGIGRAREGKERIHIWLGIGLKVDPAGRKSCATCDLEGEPCQGIVGQGQRDAARCNYYRPYH